MVFPDGGKIPIVLLANKCDIKHASVETDQIVKFCKENEIDTWYVTSAKENTNIGKKYYFLISALGLVFYKITTRML